MFLFWGRSNEALKQVSSESWDLSFSHNAFFAEPHQVQNLVERILLPFEVIRLQLRQLLLCSWQRPLLEAEGKNGLAQWGDRVMERWVVCGCVVVGVHHFRLILGSVKWRCLLTKNETFGKRVMMIFSCGILKMKKNGVECRRELWGCCLCLCLWNFECWGGDENGHLMLETSRCGYACGVNHEQRSHSSTCPTNQNGVLFFFFLKIKFHISHGIIDIIVRYDFFLPKKKKSFINFFIFKLFIILLKLWKFLCLKHCKTVLQYYLLRLKKTFILCFLKLNSY